MTYLVPLIRICPMPVEQVQFTPSAVANDGHLIRAAKSPWRLSVELIRELAVNLRRFLRLVKTNHIKQAATLSVVKLMDYSDHLPLKISPPPYCLAFQERDFMTSALKVQFADLEDICKELKWRFDENSRLEISYNASLGEAEVHPHLTHAFVKHSGGRNSLHIRYFDDESTVWQKNPCRASTITVAEITIDAQTRQLQALRYFRFRSPKRNKFNRKDAVSRLNNLLDSSLPFSGLDPHLITFGLEYSSQAQQILCRYTAKPRCALLRWSNQFIIHSQLSIVSAILKENIAFTKLGIYRQDEFKTAARSSLDEKKPSSVLKGQYGRKQLRLRLL